MAGREEILKICQSLLKVIYSYWLFDMDIMFNVEKSQVCYGRIEYLSNYTN
jgi:hypothetical protein